MNANAAPPDGDLGRRERQILAVLFRLGRATANEVHRRLPDPPSYSSVRKMLAYLESKGHVRHASDGVRYIYEPTLGPERARRSALRHMLDTFFAGSESALVTTLVSDRRMSQETLNRLGRLIDEAKHERKQRGT